MKRLLTIILTVLYFNVIGQINYDFESDDLLLWTQKPMGRWIVTTSNPLSGIKSLKHGFNNTVASTDTIYCELPAWNVAQGAVTWRMLVKHSYDPSSSNNWCIYLMADSLTTGNSTCGSGYAVGVNLTGSDDLLKIWRIDTGVPQVLLASTLNWQTQIGTSKVGAIEIERLADGTFTLRASVNGSFLDLNDFGTAVDTQHEDFNYFGIHYKYSASADQNLMVDDIAITYQPQNLNNTNTAIYGPTTQIASSNISSICNNEESAVNVFRIVIEDQGAGDFLPTYVKRFAFRNPLSTVYPWSNIIEGIKITQYGEEVSILSTNISDENIIVDVDSTQVIIPDGTAVEYILAIYLKNNNLVDGTRLNFEIDAENHGFLSSILGSGFTDVLPADLLSNEFTIQVNATQLKFIEQPVSVGINKQFTLSVVGCDINGNTDMDFNQSISLGLNIGEGILTSAVGLSQFASNGLAQWLDLSYNKKEEFQLKASSTEMEMGYSNSIEVTYDTTSIVEEPYSQPLAATVSSLQSTADKAFEIIRIKITDPTNGDYVSTYLQSIRLSAVSATNTATLSKSIEGVLVTKNGLLCGLSSVIIKSSTIDIYFPISTITIPDGSSVELSVWLYLKNSGINDGENVQLGVDSLNSGFTCFESGSGLASQFPARILSNIFTINVEATELSFAEVPERVGVQEPFAVKIAATDINENIDKSYIGPVSLELVTGTGVLSFDESNSDSLNSGEVTYGLMQYSKPELFKLIAQSTDLDDVSSNFITCGDNDGTASAAIYSMDSTFFNASNSSSATALEIIRVKLKDGGTSDGLPLIPTKIILECFNPSSILLLSRMVKGVLINAFDTIITPLNFSFSDNELTINFAENELTIADGDSADISISFFLNENGLLDGEQFQIYIPTENHQWESSSLGTAFNETFTSTIYGKPCKVEIVTTRLMFAECPSLIASNHNFALKIAATDENGNVDKNYLGYAEIGLNSGAGEIHASSFISPISMGFAEWTDVSVDTVGVFTFEALSDSLPDAVSPEILCGYGNVCSVYQEFEGVEPFWNGIENWKASSITPISGNLSLIHAGNPDDGENIFTIPFNFGTVQGFPIEWNITVRNGDWDPSSENYFYFVAASSDENLSLSTVTGIAVGINPSTGSDFLSLWTFEGGNRASKIETNYDWNNNDELHIKLFLSPKGNLQLWYTPKKTGCMVFGGETILDKTLSFNWAGFVFGYSPSRAGQLWIDNLSICHANYPPVIVSAKPINLTSVRVVFSKDVLPESALNTNNYQIKSANGHIINVKSAIQNDEERSEVVLYTDNMPFEELVLVVNGLVDEWGYSLTDSINFGIGTEGNIGRLIINEIMANPAPSVGLPEYEYVELYNPSSDSVSISGWKMQFNETTVTLPVAKIPPLNYAVIGSNTASSYLLSYGQTIGVTSFPLLLNDGMFLKLFDNNGNLISFANYSKYWYANETRCNGGYSLERIDATNIAEGANNWIASNSDIGGTPCAVNSVNRANSDNTKPIVISVEVLSEYKIEIQFSEPMDSLSIMQPSHYSLDNEVGFPLDVNLSGELFDKIILTLSIPMALTEIYELTILDGIVDFAGNGLNETRMKIGIPETPLNQEIVINEILFNPYTGGVDFVELYNNSSKIVDLKRMFVGNRDLVNMSLSQVYSASDTAYLLFPNEFAVITTNPSMVSQFYLTQNPNSICWVSNLASFNNDEGYVVLLDDSLMVVDEIYYTDKLHNKLILDVKGVSLERINPNLSSSETSSWHSAAQTVGFATPTYKNSQFAELQDVSSNFTVMPETLSPDGDGKDDFLLIEYKLPEAGFVANIRVYSSNGAEVYRLANNLLLGTEGVIRWDGINFSNQKVSVGIYIIYIEYFNLKGEVKKEKKVCVVASRS